MLCVTVSVVLFVYFGKQKDKYAIKQHQHQPVQTQPSESAGRICGVIMLLATAAFLVLGFIFHLWHPGWLAFPIGGILCGVVSVALSKPNEG